MITADKLTKIYDPDFYAIKQISFSVKEGEIYGFLGPNGAGKSSTIKILTTLSLPTSGSVKIAGFDVTDYPDDVRQLIGYVGQDVGVDFFMTGRENLVLQGHFYRMTKKDINRKVDELFDLFDLKEEGKNLVSTYSGGMRRKLDIATALIHNPKILFLDEPTLGLDPHSRNALWEHIKRLNKEFKLTIFLTTHYLDEADKLAHRISIVHKGEMQVTDSPDSLKNSIKGDSVTLSFDSNSNDNVKDPERFFRNKEFIKNVVREKEKYHIYVNSAENDIPKIINILNTENVKVKSINLSRPTLDDVFLKYTGVAFKEDDTSDSGGNWWDKWQKGGSNGSNDSWDKNKKVKKSEEETNKEDQASANGGWDNKNWKNEGTKNNEWESKSWDKEKTNNKDWENKDWNNK